MINNKSKLHVIANAHSTGDLKNRAKLKHRLITIKKFFFVRKRLKAGVSVTKSLPSFEMDKLKKISVGFGFRSV